MKSFPRIATATTNLLSFQKPNDDILFNKLNKTSFILYVHQNKRRKDTRITYKQFLNKYFSKEF